MATAKKNTVPLPFAEQVEAKEAELLASVPGKRVEAEELAERAEQAADDVQDAKSAFESIKARLGRGDDSVSVEEYVRAEAAAERLQLLAPGLSAKAKRAREALPNASKELATLVSDAVRDVLPGVSVIPTFAVPDHPEGTDGLPVAFVVSKSESRTAAGEIKGEVEVIYYRSELFTPLDPRKVDKAFIQRGWNSREPYATHMNRGLQRVDTLRITNIRAHDSAPVIPGKVQTKLIDQLGRSVAYEFIDAAPVMSGEHTTPQGLDSGTGARGKGLTAEVVEVHHREEAPDSNGVRRVEAAIGIRWQTTRLGDDPFKGDSYGTTMRAIESRFVGRLILGLGVAEKIELYTPDVPRRTNDMQIFGLRFTLASREA
ncbi:hypothetical protein ACWGN9_05990 [Streptomyces sp. NPDC055775]